jgi:hypothetical protein
VTLVAAVLMVLAAGRLVPSGTRAPWLVTLATAAALWCSSYGLLGALSRRERAPVPVVFTGEAGSIRVHEDRVTVARARPVGQLAVAAVLALAVGLMPRRRRRAAARRRVPPIVWLVSFPYALTFLGGLFNPPRGYDALWYHLPSALAFARDQHLEPPGRDLVFYFPANVELLLRSAYDVFGAHALSLVQWPFALGAAAGASVLARAIGFRRASPFAAALVLSAPMIVHQSALAYTDVVALFFVVVAAGLLVQAVRAPRLATALGLGALSGLLLGVELGAKYAAVPLVLALAPVLALYALAPSGRFALRHLGRGALLCGTVAIAALPPSWFWYARNFRLTGNPLFPIAVPWLHLPGLFVSTAFNQHKELELVAARWQWALYPWLEKTSHESGFGAGFVVLVPVALLLLGGRLFARHRPLPAHGLPLLWGAIYLLAWWFGTPHEVRHLLPLSALFGAPAVGLLERAPASAVRPVVCGLCFSTVVTVRTLLFSPTAELSVRPHNADRLYDLPAALTRLIPEGARIANRAGRPYNFPLTGPRRSFRVFDYAPRWPTLEELRYHQVDFVFYRGSPSAVPLSELEPLFVDRPRNLAWWESGKDDVIALYRVPR